MGPIAVSAPGTSLTGTVGKDVTFSTRYPFAKLDSTNNVSFQTITILFGVDTPSPDGTDTTTNSTLVYQFAHGYKYVPSTWFMVSVNAFTSALGTEGVYLVGGGDAPTLGSAYITAQVDATNVYFYINKLWVQSGGLPAPTVLGITLTIRSYIFVNDLSGMDIPSQP
jgi:hypothetical protein